MAMSETREKYLRDLSERFRDTIVSERLYLEPHLSLADVADRFGVLWHDLSYSVNTYLGKSYTDFMNELRIGHAVNLLQSPEGRELKIGVLSRMAGFSDRTTFCRVCKKVTGLSPTDLKEQSGKE